jgi:hypothetical protein
MDHRMPARIAGCFLSAVAGRRTAAVLVITILLLGCVLAVIGLCQEGAPAEKPTRKPLAAQPGPNGSSPRTWTTNDGKHTVEATFLKVEAQKVWLRRADGKIVAVPLEVLSDADRKYVAGRAGKEASAPAAPAAKSRPVQKKTKPSKADPRTGPGNVARALAQAAKLEFQDTPLEDAMDAISAQYGVEIILCKRPLVVEGIGTDKPITERIDGVKLEKALGMLLKDLKLAYDVCDNTILVTTLEQADAKLTTRVYPVSAAAAVAAGAIGRAGNRGPLTVSFKKTIEVLTSTVAPTSWEGVGGRGSVRGIWLGSSGALVVNQSSDVHKEVAALLKVSPVTVSALPATTRGKNVVATALGQTFPVDFRQVKLEDVIAELGSRTKVPFRVSRKSLEEQGMALDTPVTFRAAGLTLRNVLTYMLADLQLDWTVDEGVIVVASSAEIEGSGKIAGMFTAVSYAVGDLMKGGASADDLVEVITGTVSPLDWEQVGGRSSIATHLTAAGPTLTVSTTYRIQEQVNKVLTALRGLAGGPGKHK